MIILNRKSIEDVFKSKFIVGCVGRRGNGEEHICGLILSSTVGEEWAIMRWMSAVKTKMHDFFFLFLHGLDQESENDFMLESSAAKCSS